MFSTKKIDPAKLTAKTKPLFTALVAIHSDVQIFDNSKIFRVPTNKPGKFQDVALTKPVVGYTAISKKTGEIKKRFAVCEAKAFASGANSQVYASDVTIKPSADNGDFEIKPKKQAVWRYIPQADMLAPADQNKMIGRMNTFLHKVSIFNAKDPILANKHHHAALITKRFPGKSLFEYLKLDAATKGGIFTIEQRIKLTLMMADAIETHLHKNEVIHRDIQANNIIVELDANNNPISATIIDMSSAKWKHEKHINENVGTVGYQAPEMLDKQNASSDELSDAYSFATMLSNSLWQLVLQDPKFSDLAYNQKLAIDYILNKGRRELATERASIGEIAATFQSLQKTTTPRPNA